MEHRVPAADPPCMRPLRLTSLAAALLAAAGLAAAPGDARAGLLVAAPTSCPDPGPVAKTFAPWSDPADYVLAPGGGFEAGMASWALKGGAAVTAGNEPFAVRAAGDRASLTLPSGASATSPAMCIGQEHPTFRAFARAAGSPLGLLRVEVLWRSSTGEQRAQVVDLASATAFAAWGPTKPMMAATAIPLVGPAEQTPVSFRFTNLPGRTTWTVDDVFVDPFRGR